MNWARGTSGIVHNKNQTKQYKKKFKKSREKIAEKISRQKNKHSFLSRHFLIMKKYDCKNCTKVYTSKTIEKYFETQEWEFLIEDPVIELHGSGTLTRKMFCTNCKDVAITDENGSSDMELEVEGPSPRGFGHYLNTRLSQIFFQ